MHIRQAITTKYVGPTNLSGSRIIVSAQAGRMIVPWDHALDTDENHTRAAQAFADKWEWKGKLVGGALPNGRGNCYVFAEED